MDESLKILWLKPHPKYAYFEGDTAELQPEEVAELTKSGHVILFPGVDEKEENPLPADLPSRDLLFENGFTTVEAIQTAGESIKEIKGIGKKSFVDITAFLSA